MEWEQTESILQWLASFDVESKDFLQDPKKLLNSRVLTQVYNQLATDQIDLASLKAISGDTDWVNMMLNFRILSVKISGVLKENKIDASCELQGLTRNKDQHQLYLFLKMFFLYAIKSPHRSKAAAAISSLPSPHQSRLNAIIEEISKKDAPEGDSPEHQRQLELLQSELAALREKSATLTAEVAEKSKEVSLLATSAAAQLESDLASLKEKHDKALLEQRTLQAKLEKRSATIAKLKDGFQEMKEKQAVLQESAGEEIPESVQTLELRLSSLQQKILAATGGTPHNQSVESYLALFEFPQKKAELESLQKSLEVFKIEKARKAAEATALRETLNTQNQRASTVMLKKIAQLNAEMDQSPLGEAKKLSLKYRRIIQKLSAEIETLEKSGGAMEIGQLQNEVQLMAQRKAYESDLLAKKLSFMHATSEQCDLRLQRIKLHVELQRHANRVKRWKNCFALDDPEKK